MPKKIIIVRHGQTPQNKKRILQGHLDTELDETGLSQAKQAARLLKDEVIDVVFSSDLKRALQTAKTAVQEKQINTTPLLRERYFGKFQGMTFKEIGQYLSKFGEQGNFSFRGREKEFGVETEEELHERIRQFKKILGEHKGKSVAVFTHGGLMRAFLKSLGIDLFEGKSIPNTAIVVLIKRGNKYIIEQS